MCELDKYLSDAKTVGISGHIRPDGDCVGSCLALYNYIVENYKDITPYVFLENPDSKFNIISNFYKIQNTTEDDVEFDVFFAMDSGDRERLGNFVSMFDRAKMTVCIDHHISNEGYAMENYISPKSSSASEVLFGLMDEEKINKDIAEALYLGISHDSGCFRYSCTSSNTMVVASKLINKGINIVDLLEETFFIKSYQEQKITARIMLESELLFEKKCIYGCCTTKMMNEYNVKPIELGGVVSELRNIEGVECAVFIYQTGDDAYKVSLRSNRYLNVSEIAVKFGGGGHVRASGYDVKGNLEKVKRDILSEIEKNIK